MYYRRLWILLFMIFFSFNLKELAHILKSLNFSCVLTKFWISCLKAIGDRFLLETAPRHPGWNGTALKELVSILTQSFYNRMFLTNNQCLSSWRYNLPTNINRVLYSIRSYQPQKNQMDQTLYIDWIARYSSSWRGYWQEIHY